MSFHNALYVSSKRGRRARFAKLYCLSGKFVLLLTGILENFDIRANSTARVDNRIDSSFPLFSLPLSLSLSSDLKSILSKL